MSSDRPMPPVRPVRGVPLVKFVTFVISFLTALLMVVLCVVGMVLAARDPQAEGAAPLIYCGPLLLLPFAGWGLLEWLSFRSGGQRGETQAALCSTAFGGLLVFVGATGLMQRPDAAAPREAEAVLAVVLALGAWLAGTGLWRLRAVNTALLERSGEDEAAAPDADDETAAP